MTTEMRNWYVAQRMFPVTEGHDESSSSLLDILQRLIASAVRILVLLIADFKHVELRMSFDKILGNSRPPVLIIDQKNNLKAFL